VDLQPLFFRLTLDTATEFLFGESVKSLNSIAGSEEDSFQQAYDLAQSRLANRGRLGKLIHLCSDREFDAACKTVHQFVDKIIFKSLEKLHPRDAEKSIDGNGRPERYVFLTEMLKSTTDPKQLRDELLNILLAGRDTTASLLSNTFHVLARRPDIWKKLKAEVDGLQGLKPNYETLRNMKYLKYLLNECLCPFSILSEAANVFSFTALSRCAKQRTLCQQGYSASSRRRSKWRVPSLYTQRRNCCVSRLCDA
jgi:cytochrome P450